MVCFVLPAPGPGALAERELVGVLAVGSQALMLPSQPSRDRLRRVGVLVKRAVFWEGELGPACVGKQEHRARASTAHLGKLLVVVMRSMSRRTTGTVSLRSSFDIGSRELKLA